MEESGSPRLVDGIGNAVRRKQTHTFRRRPESSRDVSLVSPIRPSDDDNSGGDDCTRRKVISLSLCASKFPGPESDKAMKKKGLDELNGSNKKWNSEGALAPISGPSLDGLGAGMGNKVKKVKLKLGGVTRTIDANSSLMNSMANHKGAVDKDNSVQSGKRNGLQGIPWKGFSSVGISLGREESSPAKGKNVLKPDSVRKNRRASKKRALDDDVSDDEIRYLEKLKNPRLLSGFGDDDEESSKKHRKLSKLSEISPQCMEDNSLSRSRADEDEEVMCDGELDTRKTKKARREPVDSPAEPKRELTLTARQRALHSVKDTSVVEFPNGLPPAPSRCKPKEVLTEVEQQLRKTEAAQKRKMQNEKAARETEAEAIRKILGQDSSRKKKDDKKKKHVADLAKVKAADELMLASSTVRLVMGPNSTTVTFPNEMGLPSIFSGPRSYPPPREKCAGPSCSNPYKYRDSKTKVPLCSLQCYKAVQGNVQSEAATC